MKTPELPDSPLHSRATADGGVAAGLTEAVCACAVSASKMGVAEETNRSKAMEATPPVRAAMHLSASSRRPSSLSDLADYTRRGVFWRS